MYAVFTLDMTIQWVESNSGKDDQVVGQMGHFKWVKNRFGSIKLHIN